MKARTKQKIFIFCCLFPAAVLFTLFMVLPTFTVFRMSFFEKGAYSSEKMYVGFENFKTLFRDFSFIRSCQNTIFLIVTVFCGTLIPALFFANVLLQSKSKFKNFLRILFYIPNILSVVVISGIFSALYDSDQGLLNGLLSLLSGKTVSILWKSEENVLYSILFAMVWQAVGYYMVMYMSSISQIPKSIYESADLDGVGRFRRFFEITLPLIWMNVRTTLTFFVISTVNMSFLFVKAMTSGGPNGASEVVLSFMYKEKDAGLYGYSMAAGVVIFMASFLLSSILNRVTRRETLEY